MAPASISLAGAGRPHQGRPVLRPGDITDVFVGCLVKDHCAHGERGVGQEALATNPASLPIGARVCGVSNRR